MKEWDSFGVVLLTEVEGKYGFGNKGELEKCV